MSDYTIYGKDGPFEIPMAVRQGLYARYPGIDVHKELALMALWTFKNPARRPANGVRFAENWLKKIYGKPKIKGAAHAEKARAGSRAVVANPPALPTIGPAAPVPLTGTPPVIQALVTAAGPTPIRLSAGPRSLADVLAPLKAALSARRA